GRYLIQAGFTVLPVHPKRSGVWGLDTYPSLLDTPGHVDVVNLFRAAVECPGHARECLSLSPWPVLFWMQSGIRSPESRRILEDTTIRVVEDSCLMVEHHRLCGAGS
ncbi:MAG: CoA-binding protein, partial [Desulfohalobiaceae bacterium]